MKHAILILAHKDFYQLRHLIEYFVKDCYVYVHIDKKASIKADELYSIVNMPQVRAVYRRYKVHWGGFSILKTELFLLQQVIKDGDCEYVHLISGQDYPIKPLEVFLKYFKENKGKEFIRTAIIPNPRWDNYTFSRFQYYYPYDYIEKNRTDTLSFMRKIIRWEKNMGIKRKIPDHFKNLYGSTQWFSISKNAVHRLLEYTLKKPSFYRRTKWTFAPEEYYVATILSNLLPKQDIVPKDLRFIRWKNENGNCPANLGREHFCYLACDKSSFFARKLEGVHGFELISLIDKYLLHDNECVINSEGGWDYNGFMNYSYYDSLAIAIRKLCYDLNVRSALDIGCGAGFYVAHLRQYGIPIAGYDINPHTPTLSSYLLPEGDELCGVGDITEEIESDDTFDIVICMDCLQSLPSEKRLKAIYNIALVSSQYILISSSIGHSNDELNVFDDIINTFKQFHFYVNAIGSKMLNVYSRQTHQKFSLLEHFYY